MRIGMIAVSGVRISNERLRRLGVTLPGFVERARVIASMPSLGLLTLAGATPPEHEVAYLECPDFDPATLGEFDLVAISSFTAKADVMYAIADHYRARGVPVVLGGLHCTLLPEEAAEHGIVVAGEGEAAWPRVLADVEAGRPQRIYRAPAASFAQAPMPRYDLLDFERYNRIPVQTARGCPLDCEFCAASKVLGAYKRKPVARVVEEIREIKRRWPRPFIELADDNTFVNKPWSRELVRAIAAEEVHWFTETDVSVADDPELLDLLRGSGCRQLLIGFESPRAASLDGLDAANWKSKRFDGYRRSIDAIQSRGITVNGCFITGLDGDTPDVFGEIERFVKASGLVEVQTTVLTPFPGTGLYRRLKAQGRLLRERYWEQCTLFDVTYRPKLMSVKDLEQGIEYLMGPSTRPRRRPAAVAPPSPCSGGRHERIRRSHSLNVRAGLVMLPLGLLAGLAMSLYSFHPIVQGLWAYDDLPRRLLRLGHIAAVMLPLINIVVGPYVRGRLASQLLIWGAAGLPLALAAEAFVPALRPLHPSGVPALAFTLGTLITAAGALRTSGGPPGSSSPPCPRSGSRDASNGTRLRCPAPLAK